MKVAVLSSVLCLLTGLVSSRALPAAEAEASAIEARLVVLYTAAPSLMVPIKEETPNTPVGAVSIPAVQRVS